MEIKEFLLQKISLGQEALEILKTDDITHLEILHFLLQIWIPDKILDKNR